MENKTTKPNGGSEIKKDEMTVHVAGTPVINNTREVFGDLKVASIHIEDVYALKDDNSNCMVMPLKKLNVSDKNMVPKVKAAKIKNHPSKKENSSEKNTRLSNDSEEK